MKFSLLFLVLKVLRDDLEFFIEGFILILCCEYLGRINRFFLKLFLYYFTFVVDFFFIKYDLFIVVYISVLVEVVLFMVVVFG